MVADPHQLEQVFLNIVNNALDAMVEGSGSGVLKVRVFKKDAFVCVEFDDSGPGIKDPSRIFDPFYTTKSVGKGTGLGIEHLLRDRQGTWRRNRGPQSGRGRSDH